MPLSENDIQAKVKFLLAFRNAERNRLERIHSYLREMGDRPVVRGPLGREGPFWWLAPDVPEEVKSLARMCRVNVLNLVVDVVVQALYVDGFRTPEAEGNAPGWDIWQANKMDARQIGVHRSAARFGASYVTVLPGEPVPVLRGVSPRQMTVVYGDDDDWPEFALERRRSLIGSKKAHYRLYDTSARYTVEVDGDDGDKVSLVRTEKHDVGKTPVVRFRNEQDDDGETGEQIIGEVEPLLSLQDQINVTTFGLLVAQHFGAFRQRYIMGWIADSEEKKLQATASKIWTFEDGDEKIQVGEFAQTDLKGYIESREATLRHLSTVSQTPAHELLGQLVNMSAEALAAAEASSRRKILERQTVLGESHEQALGLGGEMMGFEADPAAMVRWRDTETRSMAQMADALGKLASLLGVPAKELWERVPGVTQQEVDRWKAAAKAQPPAAVEDDVPSSDQPAQ